MGRCIYTAEMQEVNGKWKYEKFCALWREKSLETMNPR